VNVKVRRLIHKLDLGQLGLNDTVTRNKPTQITTLSDIIAINAGFQHTIALDKFGNLWTFGSNKYGELGIGNTSDEFSPVPCVIESLKNSVVRICAGSHHNLVIDNDSRLWGFGCNKYSQLGAKTQVEIFYEPISNVVMQNVVEIFCGGYTSIVKDFMNRIFIFGLHFQQSDVAQEHSSHEIFPTPSPCLFGAYKEIILGGDNVTLIDNDGFVYYYGTTLAAKFGPQDLQIPVYKNNQTKRAQQE
jgi:alpha-tubulin suppressor-like RCC1 family protein